MEFQIILFRLFLIFLLALIFGLERQHSNKPVGFGTFIFVAIGSCSLALLAIIVSPENPLPVLGAIVTGIGFLGAGALIKTTDKIFGFTTAASIWLFSIIGLIVGIGFYFIALNLYFFIWICIFIDKYLEFKGKGSYRKQIKLDLKGLDKDKELPILFNKFKIKKYSLLEKKLNKKDKTLSISYILESSGETLNKFMGKIEKLSYIVKIELK